MTPSPEAQAVETLIADIAAIRNGMGVHDLKRRAALDRVEDALKERDERIAELGADLAEWQLEAERRGMPIENAKRLYRAEAEVKRLRGALRAIASEVHGREKIPNIYEFARAALANDKSEEE